MPEPEVPVGPVVDELTIDEMEKMETAPEVIEEALPEEFTGKTPAELAKLVASTREAVKVSEQARLTAEAAVMARGAVQPVYVQPAPVAPVDELAQFTDEKLDELMGSDNPADRRLATKVMIAKESARLATAYEGRMAGMAQSSASSAEMHARQADPEAFELFGTEIAALTSRIPASNLSTQQSWKLMIAAIRGTDEGLAKVIAHREAKKQAEAQAAQVASSGFTPRSPATPSQVVGSIKPGHDYGLDDTQKKIAELQFPAGSKQESYAQYAKYSRMG